MSVSLGFQEIVISNVIEQKNGHAKFLLNPRVVVKAEAEAKVVAAKVVAAKVVAAKVVAAKVVAAKVVAKAAAKVAAAKVAAAKNLNRIIRLIIYFIIMINYNTPLY
jgi:hypothetical protein